MVFSKTNSFFYSLLVTVHNIVIIELILLQLCIDSSTKPSISNIDENEIFIKWIKKFSMKDNSYYPYRKLIIQWIVGIFVKIKSNYVGLSNFPDNFKTLRYDCFWLHFNCLSNILYPRCKWSEHFGEKINLFQRC